MRYRSLGRTGIKVSEIGLGTEYLKEAAGDTVEELIAGATDQGLNYMDIVFAFPEYRDNIGAALKGRRDEWILTGHIGCGDAGGQYVKVRDVESCERTFEDLLRRLHTDHVDIILLQFVSGGDYKQTMGGMLDFAKKMVREEKARYIGISGHGLPVMLKAIRSGDIDVAMFPRNIIRAGERDLALLDACEKAGVGFVAMKPFAGGRALRKNVPSPVTPGQCLGYVLSDPRVSTAVPGFQDLEELTEGLALMDGLESPPARIIEEEEAVCMYCNHCQPCPAGLDIGKVMRLRDVGRHGVTDNLRKKYGALDNKASGCIECGECTARCPFGVDAPARIKEAAGLFEGS